MIRVALTGKSILTALLCLLVFWAPLPFASVTPLARTVILAASFLAVSLAVISTSSFRSLRPAAPIGLSVAAIGLLALVSSQPWPGSLVRLLSPAHFALAGEAASAVGREAPGWVAPSLAPEASRLTGLSWLAAAGLLVAAAIAGRRRRRRRWLVGALLGSAVVQAVLGLRVRLGGIVTIWGAAETSDPDLLRGTFVNQNHAAFFFTVSVAVAGGVAWWGYRRAARDASTESRVLLYALPAVLWLALLLSLALTGSRAGLAAALVAITIQAFIVAQWRRQWWLMPIVLGTALVVAASSAITGGLSSVERMVGTSVTGVAQSYRLEAWKACIELWRQFPLLGTGAGSFREAFPMVQPQTLVRESWYHAHNDLLELLVTGGVVTFAVFVVGLGMVFARLLRILKHARRTEDQAFTIAAVGMIAGAAVHELFDFGLTIPANWVAVTVVLGAFLGIWIRSDSPRQVESVREPGNGRGGETARVDVRPL